MPAWNKSVPSKLHPHCPYPSQESTLRYVIISQQDSSASAITISHPQPASGISTKTSYRVAAFLGARVAESTCISTRIHHQRWNPPPRWARRMQSSWAASKAYPAIPPSHQGRYSIILQTAWNARLHAVEDFHHTESTPRSWSKTGKGCSSLLLPLPPLRRTKKSTYKVAVGSQSLIPFSETR